MSTAVTIDNLKRLAEVRQAQDRSGQARHRVRRHGARIRCRAVLAAVKEQLAREKLDFTVGVRTTDARIL